LALGRKLAGKWPEKTDWPWKRVGGDFLGETSNKKYH
jgi:hypothetical protein